jgi:hypothetical protein
MHVLTIGAHSKAVNDSYSEPVCAPCASMEGDAKSDSAAPPTTPIRSSALAAAEVSAENGHNARSSSMDTAIQKQVSSVQSDVCFQIFGQDCGALVKSGHHGRCALHALPRMLTEALLFS